MPTSARPAIRRHASDDNGDPLIANRPAPIKPSGAMTTLDRKTLSINHSAMGPMVSIMRLEGRSWRTGETIPHRRWKQVGARALRPYSIVTRVRRNADCDAIVQSLLRCLHLIPSALI